MPCQSTIELTNLEIPADIGSYGREDVKPEAHLLDLTLTIDPALVLIDADGMDRVFDYDPLIAEILRLAQDGPYETQERLMTRIVHACAGTGRSRRWRSAFARPRLRAGPARSACGFRVDRAHLDGLR